MGKLKFSEARMNDLLERRRTLLKDIQNLQERIEIFTARRPYTKFRYMDPEPNFNKRTVKGVVCHLFKCDDSKNCMALETAAGGRVCSCYLYYLCKKHYAFNYLLPIVI